MYQLVVYAAVITQLSSLNEVAGAPRLNVPAAPSGLQNTAMHHPKEEMELESLKHSANNKGTVGTSASSVAPPAVVTTPPVNQEHPAPSDNDNDNSEKFFSQALSVRSPATQFEDKVADLLERFSYNMNSDYTPQDIAEYIFWTGDEKGVALALNDFLQDDLVPKEDLLRFLDDVKLELNVLRSRYARINEFSPISVTLDSSKLKSKFTQPQMFLGKVPDKRDLPSGMDAFPLDLTRSYLDTSDVPRGQSFYGQSSGEDSTDYEEMFEKLRQNDPRYREASLKEIIYELARDLFEQEVTDKSQRSIQRFAKFLENESAAGRIPKDLSRTVLDTLVGALLDSVTEQAKTWKPSHVAGASPSSEVAIPLTRSKISPDEPVSLGGGRKKAAKRK